MITVAEYMKILEDKPVDRMENHDSQLAKDIKRIVAKTNKTDKCLSLPSELIDFS